MSELNKKQILIGISGGIAAYKTAELVRALIKKGADVRICMTKAACEFITPLTLQALTGNPVHTNLLDPQAEAAMGHIELARWADLIMIAPATADLIARLAHGHANDLLSTICLASDAPIHLAPAMNCVMWNAPPTQKNTKLLQQHGYTLHGPANGEQACGDVGEGRMLEAQQLADIIQTKVTMSSNQPLSGKRVLITAGPTRESIDPVRFISNRSSGKMGYAVASAAQKLGADVTLVSGPVALEAPFKVTRHFVESAKQMHRKTMELAKQADIFIATAAVSDYSPADVATQKIKKTKDSLILKLDYSPDILFDVSHGFPEVFSVGFAAETEHLAKHAKEKLKRKKLDMIVANPVGKNQGFEQNTNQFEIFWVNGHTTLPEKDKKTLAVELMDIIEGQFNLKNIALNQPNL